MRQTGYMLLVCISIFWLGSTSAYALEDPMVLAQISPVTGNLPAPDFELEDLEGNTVRLSELRGKMVLLFFWTTW